MRLIRFQYLLQNVNVIGEDMWTFTAPAVETTDANKAEDFDMMNVYPNPYYANNSQEQKIVLITLNIHAHAQCGNSANFFHRWYTGS